MKIQSIEIKKFIVKVICLPFIGQLLSIVFNNKFSSKGIFIFTDSEFINNKTKASIFWGLYEKAEIHFVRKYLNPDCDVIELGSSIGIVSSHIITKLNNNRKIICVEGNPYLIDILKKNIQHNSNQKAFFIENKIIDYRLSTSSYINISKNNTDSNITSSSKNQTPVKNIKLSNLIEQYYIEHFTLVSDIEGAEALILKNDSSSLKNCKMIIIELHDSIIDGSITNTKQLGEMILMLNFQILDKRNNVWVLINNKYLGEIREY